MANRIKSLFDSLKNVDKATKSTAFSDKDLAAAALLVEAAAMDGHLDETERETIRNILTTRFHLSPEEADELFRAAHSAQEEATHLMRFTRTLKDNYGEAERIALIEMMWEVALADGVIHDYEDSLIRRVAGLLYVSDFERGEAKKRALERIASSA